MYFKHSDNSGFSIFETLIVLFISSILVLMGDSSYGKILGSLDRSMTLEQIAYWEDVLVRIVSTDEWKREMEKNYWESNFMTSADSRKFLQAQYEEYKNVLVEVGLAR